ncbi:hypothetical protein JF66_15095 [Cryobacterium sp. MLB-32]|uniref:hypothetical protein n=1 Tax=Cryobacterium sp. MLB-32 TaxID=1529318 RepID=UPI0004E67F5B|nr:hypothetical protein [Cryobacterium sp. MLB-32]KFF58910.1 hypothetical protein JF66_15095 [Cryobacterium sp. MLB-32]
MTTLPGDQPTPGTRPFSTGTDATPIDATPSAASTASADTAPASAAPAGAAPASTTPAGTTPADTAPADTAPADTGPTRTAPRRRPRFAPIVWGAVLLACAVYVLVAQLLPAPPDPTFWLLGGIIAVGLTLVVAGIAAAARRAG